jgi:protein-tyrosine phosphatase
MAVGSPRLIRHLPFDNLFNVRDLGGYHGRAGQTLRWRQVYRADDLNRSSPEDLRRLSELGIRTIIDLRTDAEVAARGPLVIPGSPVARHHLPMLRDTWDVRDLVPLEGSPPQAFLIDRYLELLVQGAPAIADALRIIAEPEAAPVVFHCSLGKDRTGILAMVLLALLGVHDETIAEDYALSAIAVVAFTEWLDRLDAATGRRNPSPRAPEAYLAAPPEAIAEVLARVRTGGRSMVGFVRSIGVPFEVIESLHANLLI